MKNIHGKKGMSPVIMILIGIVAIVAVIGTISVVMQSGVQDTKDLPVGGCPDSTGILTIQDKSALDSGTDPGAPTFTAGVDGGDVSTSVTSGTTTFPIGAKLEVIAVIDDYIDEKFDTVMTCGGLTLSAPMYSSSSDNPSIRMKNDDGDFMTDTTGDTGVSSLVNQTAVTAGETIVWEVVFQGTNGESSGDGIWIIEFNASTNSNITSVTLDGKQPIAVPSSHTLTHAGSKAVAFEIPAIVGATTKTMSLSIELASDHILLGYALTDWYAKQWFIDDNNKLAYGIQDSTGDSKEENTLDYDVFFEA